MKKILKNKYTQLFVGWLISLYIKICFHSSIWIVKNSEIVEKQLKKKKSFIICFWHNRLLMAAFCWSWKQEVKMLISSHPDGRIISNALSHLGIQTVTGSSRKKNISSLREIINLLKENQILGITPDGPKGPRKEIKDGLISLLKKTNVTVIPVSYAGKFKLTLRTWDKFILVTPFNKFVTVWGNPIEFDKSKTAYENKMILESELNRVSLLSDNLTN